MPNVVHACAQFGNACVMLIKWAAHQEIPPNAFNSTGVSWRGRGLLQTTCTYSPGLSFGFGACCPAAGTLLATSTGIKPQTPTACDIGETGSELGGSHGVESCRGEAADACGPLCAECSKCSQTWITTPPTVPGEIPPSYINCNCLSSYCDYAYFQQTGGKCYGYPGYSPAPPPPSPPSAPSRWR
jgi:hypothetical protein